MGCLVGITGAEAAVVYECAVVVLFVMLVALLRVALTRHASPSSGAGSHRCCIGPHDSGKKRRPAVASAVAMTFVSA